MSQASSVALAVVDSDPFAAAPATVTLKGTTRGLEIHVVAAPSIGLSGAITGGVLIHQIVLNTDVFLIKLNESGSKIVAQGAGNIVAQGTPEQYDHSDECDCEQQTPPILGRRTDQSDAKNAQGSAGTDGHVRLLICSYR